MLIGILSLAHKSDYGSNVLGEHRLVRGSGSRSLYFLRMRIFSRTDLGSAKYKVFSYAVIEQYYFQLVDENLFEMFSVLKNVQFSHCFNHLIIV